MSRVIPFSNGNEFLKWKSRNCDNCTKYENKSTSYTNANCPAAFDIDMGTILGNVRRKTAHEIGFKQFRGDYVELNDKCKMKQKQ